jgi:HNH endonuclease
MERRNSPPDITYHGIPKNRFPSTTSKKNALLMKRIRDESIEDRFYRNVRIGTQYECWPWLGSVNRAGYGQMTHQSKHYAAHRVAYELFFGSIAKRDVAHRCDNRLCVNPAHLFQASRSENMQDAVAKSRISRLMLKNKQAAEGRRNKEKDVLAERDARIAAGIATAQDLSSARMRSAKRDHMGRIIKPGQVLPEPKRGSKGRFKQHERTT